MGKGLARVFGGGDDVTSSKAPSRHGENESSSARAVEWTRANTAVQQGNAKVQVKGLRIGKVEFRNKFGDNRLSEDNLLIITLAVANVSKNKKIDFSTWQNARYSFGEDVAALTDDNGNVYKRINFGTLSWLVGGVIMESIYPGESINDLLIFEKPVDAFKWLHLELPAKNLNEAGTIRFEIPSDMLSR